MAIGSMLHKSKQRRTKQMTNKQFEALARTDEGDLCNLYRVAYELTADQRDQLSDDDYHRCF